MRCCVCFDAGSHNILLMRMVFSVCPHAHVIRSSEESTVGTDEVLPVDAGSFSSDFASFSYYGCAVMVDPFVALACCCMGVTGGEGVGVGEACAEFWEVMTLIRMILIGIISVAISCCWTVVR